LLAQIETLAGKYVRQHIAIVDAGEFDLALPPRVAYRPLAIARHRLDESRHDDEYAVRVMLTQERDE